MNKIAELLKYSAKTIRELEEDRANLLEKLADVNRTEEYRKLANYMAEKDLISYDAIESKIDDLKTQKTDPKVFKQAVDMALNKKASLVTGFVNEITSPKDPRAPLINVLLDVDEED